MSGQERQVPAKRGKVSGRVCRKGARARREETGGGTCEDARPAGREVFVGVDVSKQRLDVHTLGEDLSESFENSPEGAGEPAGELLGMPVRLVVIEATGGLERLPARRLQEAGLPVAVANPRRVRQFAGAAGILAKTDALDARVLALFAREIRPRVRPLCPRERETIRALSTRREQLVRLRTAEVNRRDRQESAAVRESIDAVLRVLDEQIAAVEEKLDEAVEESPSAREADRLLRSVPGVSKTTSRALLAALPEIGSLSGKEAASLAGLAPYARDSGTLRGRRMISGGRSAVRRALYMPTLVARNHNPDIKNFYDRLEDAGKPGKVAITACMRKLLVTLNAVVKRGTEWTPDYA